MDGFGQQEIGLFTFYRQQAQRQKQLQEQKKQKQKLRKLRYQAHKLEKDRKNQEQKERRKKLIDELRKIREKSPTKIDYSQKAKDYIKQLEIYGPYRFKIHSHHEENDNRNISVNLGKQDIKHGLSMAFRPKKQNFSKVQHYFFDRIAISPKDFGNLDEIIEQSKQRQRYKKQQHDKKNRLSEKAQSMILRKRDKLLPELSHKRRNSNEIFQKNIQPQRINKLYNSKNILQNNEKYFGKKNRIIKHSSMEQPKYKSLASKKDQNSEFHNAFNELYKKYPILQ